MDHDNSLTTTTESLLELTDCIDQSNNNTNDDKTANYENDPSSDRRQCSEPLTKQQQNQDEEQTTNDVTLFPASHHSSCSNGSSRIPPPPPLPVGVSTPSYPSSTKPMTTTTNAILRTPAGFSQEVSRELIECIYLYSIFACP